MLELLYGLQMSQTLQILIGVNNLNDVAAFGLWPMRIGILEQNGRRLLLFARAFVALRRQFDLLDLARF